MFAALIVGVFLSPSRVHGQIPNAAFPVGSLATQMSTTQTGAIANLEWHVRLPDGDNPADYSHFIRQVRSPDNVTFDASVAQSGQMLSQPITGMTNLSVELWSVDNRTLDAYRLDAAVCSLTLPTAAIVIRSEDPYPVLPRTRADRPFQVEISIEGLSDDPGAPDPLRSITVQRHVQSYGTSGVGNNIDRSQGALHSETTINDNGVSLAVDSEHVIPGEESTKVRGEERFSIMTVASHEMPASIIDSGLIQIWPVADSWIEGLVDGQSIGPSVPDLTIHLKDLYPSSTSYAQVYRGTPQTGVAGRIVPESMFAINGATPQDRVATVRDYLALFDSDGVWTMEILTQSPFGMDRLTSVSFTVEGTASIRENWRLLHFGDRDPTGDGADANDFDHDGMPNLLEFAFGLNPRIADRELLPVAERSGDGLVVEFHQPSNVGGVTYFAEWSPDLQPGSWTQINNSAVPPAHVFSLSSAGHPAAFIRLKVVGK